MAKRYTIRYTDPEGSATTTAISNYSDLMDILKGNAKDSIVETKMHENMPLVLHNAIAKHNSEVEQRIQGGKE